MTFLISVVIGIVVAVVLLTILILIHEAGHFFAAKFFGVKVEEFGLGFGPRILKKKKGETIYSINAVPAGGFVRLFGEEGDAADNPASFAAKKAWVRSAIIFAGVAVNFLMAFLLFTILLASNGFKTEIPLTVPSSGEDIEVNFPFGTQSTQVSVLLVDPGSPADIGGLKAGDKIISANGQSFDDIKQLQTFIKGNGGREINFKVVSTIDRSERSLTVTPKVDPKKGEGMIGVFLGKVATLSYQSLIEKLFVGPLHSANTIYFQAKVLGGLFGKAVQEGKSQVISDNVKGPIGIVALLGIFIGKASISGLFTVIDVVALISLVLAVVNLLPIPALDGGRLFFALIESTTGFKINRKLENWIHTIGFIILLGLLLFITMNDIGFVLKIFGK